MKKTFRLIFFLLCMTFCSCTVYVDTLTHAYSAKDSKDVPLSDLSIIEPYTDISTFKTRFWEREHSDSLTLLAHEALLEVLDKDDKWELGDILVLSDSSEYESIRQDIYGLLKSTEKKTRYKEFIFHPADKKKLAAATLPSSLLDYMNRNGLPYVMILLLNGFEPSPDTSFWNRVSSSDSETEGTNGNYIEMECLVADAAQNRLDYYGREYGYGRNNLKHEAMGKPTDPEFIDEALYHLFGRYTTGKPVIKPITETETEPKRYIIGGLGYGNINPSAKGCGGLAVGPEVFAMIDVAWHIRRTPLWLGVTGESGQHKIATDFTEDAKRQDRESFFVGPIVATNKLFGKRSMVNFALGAGYMSCRPFYKVGEGGSVEEVSNGHIWSRSNGFIAENATLSYHYRLDNNLAVGIKARAFTFNNPVQADGRRRFIDMWNISLCLTTLRF